MSWHKADPHNVTIFYHTRLGSRVNHNIRISPGGCVSPTAMRGLPCPMYAFKGACWMLDDGVHMELLSLWAPHMLVHAMAATPVPTVVEFDAHDLRLQWPFRMLIAGCLGSGKSTLTIQLVVWSPHIRTRPPAHVPLFYTHMQSTFWELAHQTPTQLLDGAQNFSEKCPWSPRLL